MNTSPLSHPAVRAAAPASFAKRNRGFTLIELLTVIAIIALLMGLLFPAINSIKETARRTQAKTEINNIVTAVKAYYNEYSKYPPLDATPPTTATTTDEFVGDATLKAGVKGNNVLLMNTLRAINTVPGVNTTDRYNPRRIVFLDAKSATSLTAPKNGCLDKAPTGSSAGLVQGCYYDSWGKQYFVMMDTNYDNVLELDAIYTDIAITDRPRTSVAAWSVGKDNKLGYTDPKTNVTTPALGTANSKPADDIVSWQ